MSRPLFFKMRAALLLVLIGFTPISALGQVGFDFATGDDGWTTTDCTSATAANGALVVTTTCAGGRLESPALNTAALPFIELAVTSSTSVSLDVEFSVGGQTHTLAEAITLRGDSKARRVVVLMQEHPAWQGTVESIAVLFNTPQLSTLHIHNLAIVRAPWRGAWTFADGAQDWTANETLTDLTATNGTLAGAVSLTTSTKPRLLSPAGLRIDSRAYRSLFIRLKATSATSAQQLRVWWGTEQTPTLNVSRSATLDFVADGSEQVLRFDLFEHSKWRETVEALWIQPFLDPEEGASFTLLDVAFGPRLSLAEPGSGAVVEGAPALSRVANGALVIPGSEDPVTLSAALAGPGGPFSRLLVEATFPAATASCTHTVALRLDADGAPGAAQALPFSPICDGQRRAYVLNLATVQSAGEDTAAVDLVLQPSGSAVRLHALELLPTGPSVELTRVDVQGPAQVGADLEVQLTVQNLGASASTGGKIVAGGPFALLPELDARETAQLSITVPAALSCSQPGKQKLAISAQLPGTSELYTLPFNTALNWLEPFTALPAEVPPPEFLASAFAVGPNAALVQNPKLRVAFFGDDCLGGLGYMRLFAAVDQAWIPVGARLGLGEITTMAGGSLETFALTAGQAGLVGGGEDSVSLPINQNFVDGDGVTWTVKTQFTMPNASPWVDVEQSISASAPRAIYRAAGVGIQPGLQASASLNGGLLGGLELLGPGEPSSSSAALAHRDADRRVPDVRVVAMPVAAVVVNQITVGVMWDPLLSWSNSAVLPSIRYEVPSRDGPENTALIELVVPNTPSLTLVGNDVATVPYTLQAGEVIKIRGRLFAVPGATANVATQLQYKSKAAPPSAALDVEDTRALVTEALENTAWDSPGWRASVGSDAAPWPDVLAVARRLAETDGDAGLAKKADTARDAIGAPDWFTSAGRWVSVEAAWSEGPLVAALTSALSQWEQNAGQPEPLDGPLVGAATKSRAYEAWRLLHVGRLIGRQSAIEAGLALLDAEVGQAVPRGGLTAEGVPTDAPDVATAIDRAMASLEAWRALGDAARLDDAQRWMATALSFVFLHDMPSQPAYFTTWGVLSAFGGTHFTESRIGILSATHGARLSLAAYAISDAVPSFGWATAADGLAHAVLARLVIEGDNAGLARDGWDTRAGVATGPTVLPFLATWGLLAKTGDAPGMSQESLTTPAEETVVVATSEVLKNVWFDTDAWAVKVIADGRIDNDDVTVTVGNLSGAPAEVLVDGATHPQTTVGPGMSGWQYDADLNLLVVRVSGVDAPVTVTVPFPIPDGDGDNFPANVDCNDDNKAVYPGATEVCNGVDDDCDGKTDEAEATGFLECGIGECAHIEPACQDGAEATCDPFKGEADEVCDELDNDCDGETDEEVGQIQCGKGICEHTIYACADCDPFLDAEPEVCDLVDNDCDGETDESPGTVICGTGQCEHLVNVCDLDTCDTLQGATEEVCDLIDNNCDGQTDEGLPTVPCGTGQCSHDIPACAPCDAEKGATDETCDLVDNDCDGVTDEDTPTTPCGTGLCEKAIPSCHACDPTEGAQLEVCNAVDDDCDGETDEVEGTKPCGTGQCYQDIPVCATCEAKNGAFDEVCDGIDNDCDGETDEVTGTALCGLGICAHDVEGCTACEPLEGAVVEQCNALDDDCDGETDEVDDLGTKVCGVGVCEHELPNCTLGEATPCDPLAGAESEVCDGLDNDCDGVTDEDIDFWTCGVGQCEHDVIGCVLEGPGSCVPLLGASEETCDGVDNDCDGETDEDQGEVTCGANLGCEKTLPACLAGVAVGCNPINGLAPEVCNGQDDDCDGTTDEDQLDIICGVGSCLHAVPGCENGGLASCDPLEGAQPETCNFVDDDCDGETDEASPPVTCGKGVCETTVNGCLGGLPKQCTPLDVASPDVCNALDDDCDGETDEDQGTITCGDGACEKTVDLCLNGTLQQCDPETGAAPETCNGIDDNCDGETDEGMGTIECGDGECHHVVALCVGGKEAVCNPFEGLAPEVCDGLDNDCDGETDDKLGELTCPQPDGSIVVVEACQNGLPQSCAGGGTTGNSTGGDNDAGGQTTGGIPAPKDESCTATSAGRPTPVGVLMLAMLGLWWLRRRRVPLP